MEILEGLMCSVYLAEIAFNHGAHHTRGIKIVVMYMYLKFAKVASKTFFFLVRNGQDAECCAWVGYFMQVTLHCFFEITFHAVFG